MYKLMKSRLYILVVLTVLFSCSTEEPSEGVSFVLDFNFDSEEKPLIISHDYQVGDILVFNGSDGSKIEIEVVDVVSGSNEYGGGAGWYTIQPYETDQLRISFEGTDSRYEQPFEMMYDFKFTQFGTFHMGLDFPYWNGRENWYNGSFNIRPLLSGERIEVELNNRSFGNVYTLSSGETRFEQWHQGHVPWSVNHALWDIDFGIIQFSDVNGIIYTVE
jgi:hypothetical protein